MGIERYRTTASLNGNVLDTGSFQENQSPSSVNDGARELIRNIKQWYLDAEWIEVGNGEIAVNYTRVNGTQITINSDVTSYYTSGRRVKIIDGTGTTLYGQITNVAYNSPNTTVTMSFDGSASIGSGTITSFKLGIVNPANSSIPATSPTGSIVMWSGTSLVDGWLFTDGSLKDKTAYPNLFAILGDTYGTQTSSQFYLPNLQDKFAIGKGSTYTTLGATGGASTVTPSGTNSVPSFSGSAFTPSGSIAITGSVANHTLTIAQMPSHNHPRGSASQVGYTDDLGGGGLQGYLGGDQAVSNVNANMTTQGGDQPHNHGFSGSGSFSGSSTTPSGTVSAPSFTGTSASIINPYICLLYTSPSPRDVEESRMPSSA